MNDKGRSWRRNRRAALSVVAGLESLILLTAVFAIMFVAQPKSNAITIFIFVLVSMALGLITIVPHVLGLIAGGAIGIASVMFLLANTWWFHL
jgi:hypothetical protein